jgi:hypothetical protein
MHPSPQVVYSKIALSRRPAVENASAGLYPNQRYDNVLCEKGKSFSTSGLAPCTPCAADATCAAGVMTACATTTDTVCNVPLFGALASANVTTNVAKSSSRGNKTRGVVYASELVKWDTAESKRAEAAAHRAIVGREEERKRYKGILGWGAGRLAATEARARAAAEERAKKAEQVR